ncbi:MAG TPA: hypothetical protein PKZ74_13910, partial [Bacteroidales bacterium]|nr:hypothetical protein [Bacteroidales bacterium]
LFRKQFILYPVYSGWFVMIKIREQKEPLIGGFGGGLRTRLLGYFIRADLAWGVEELKIKKPVFYFSLSLDF